MPIIVGIILIVILLYAVVAYIIYVLPVLLAIGAVYGAGVGIWNYLESFFTNVGNEEDFSATTQPAKRNYFWGRAYKNLKTIITKSAEKNHERAQAHWEKASDFDEWWGWIFCRPFLYCGGLAIYIIGTIAFLLTSVFHIFITAIFASIVFVVYSMLWAIDAVYRACRGVSAICHTAGCHSKGKLPVYHCPTCDAEHDKLYPGKYGIFRRECKCGTKMQTAFFNGRNKLSATCPACKESIKSKETRAVAIPIVGAPSVGKTFFLNSMVWYIKERFAPYKGFKFEFMDKIKGEASFNSQITKLNSGLTLEKTNKNNPDAVNIFLTRGSNRSLLYLYDSAGEAFTDDNSSKHLVEHKFYGYFNGIIFIVDPFSIPDVYSQYKDKMINLDVKKSRESAEDVYDSFVNNLERYYYVGVKEKIEKPIAIVFSKAGYFDLPQKLGFGLSRDEMNEKCKKFLKDNGENALLRKLELKFANVQFFAVDSKGELSKGIDNVVNWLFRKIYTKKKVSNLTSYFAGTIATVFALTLITAVAAGLFLGIQNGAPIVRGGISEMFLSINYGPPEYRWYTQNPNNRNFNVSTAEELAVLARIVNGSTNKGRNNFSGRTINLTNDINLSQFPNWVPIGDHAADENSIFSGTFNGGGYVITNLSINRPNMDRQGLFGRIDGGKVENLGLTDVNIRGKDRVGAVAGVLNKEGRVINTYSAGNINGDAMIGGLIGAIAGNSGVGNSHSFAAVNGDAAVGGVAGGVNGNSAVASSYFSGTVRGRLGVGGVAGSVINDSRVSGSYFAGTVNGAEEVGGVVGQALTNSGVNHSYSTGTVSGQNVVGGVAGAVRDNSGVFNSFSSGGVSGSSGIGGVVGHVEVNSNVENCYSSAMVGGAAGAVGGVVGLVRRNSRVANNAALNPQVRGTGVNVVGRVVGSRETARNSGVTISNNVAHTEMKNNAGNTQWVNKGAATVNGADVTTDAIRRDGTIGGRFVAANGWTTVSGSLPGFAGAVIDMPAHLRAPVAAQPVQFAQTTQTPAVAPQQRQAPAQAATQTPQNQVGQARQRVERARQARDSAIERARQAAQAGDAELTRERMETARQANQMLERAEQDYERIKQEAGQR
jgi:hypothetical protein